MKSFEKLFNEVGSDEIKGKFIIYDPKRKKEQSCYACEDNKGYFSNPLKLGDEVIVDCARCKMPNSFSLNCKCEKVTKKETKS